MINQGKKNILGLLVDAIDYEYVVQKIIESAQNKQSCTVAALSVHAVVNGVLDQVHQRRLNGLTLLTPDGQPVRWALNWIYKTNLTDRVYGPDLMLKILAQATFKNLAVYFYGNSYTFENLKTNLLNHFPNLKIVGMQAAQYRRLSHIEREQVIEQIHASGAEIVFVGLGCPRQEVWLYEYQKQLSLPLIAVGAAFDFHAGWVRQAPRWMQDHGLEWLFRLCQEPGRLWKRYFFYNPIYIWLILLQWIGKKYTPLMPNGRESMENYG